MANISEGMGAYMDELLAIRAEILPRLVAAKSSEVYDMLLNHPQGRRHWVVVHKDVPHTLETLLGPITYKRRLYRPKKRGDYATRLRLQQPMLQ